MISVFEALSFSLTAIAISVGAYSLLRFSYSIRDGYLIIALTGSIPRKKVVKLEKITSVRRLRSGWELVPVLSATFPSLWGKFVPSRTVVIVRSWTMFPLMITPDDPDQMVQDLRAGAKLAKREASSRIRPLR